MELTINQKRKMKNETLVTIYSNSEFMGNIVKYEGKLIEQGTRKYAQFDNSPYVKFIQKGKRKPVQIQKTSHVTMVILEGYGHIDPPGMFSKTISEFGGTVVREASYVSFDDKWDTDFNKMIDQYIEEKNVKVIADYRTSKGFNSYHKISSSVMTELS